MPAAMGNQLNRVVIASITPADQAAGTNFVGINLDATSGSGYYLDSIEFGADLTAMADFNIIKFVTVQLTRNLILDPTIGIGLQLLGAERMTVSLSDKLQQRSLIRYFIPPLELARDARYAIHGSIDFSAAPAGNATSFFQAIGRAIVPPGSFPLAQR